MTITRLGKCFEFGVGTNINLTRALECYAAADILGSPEGACRLALFLKIYEKKTSPNYIYGLFCKAAEGGIAEGAYQKGLCLEFGFGAAKRS